ncbi:MAG TPA: UbiA family prenyltransferase, partial [Synergistales bacterium]|nr:UbiA family prenyltransferase [Synergistales bacterium]
MTDYLQLMRVQQWVKNLFIFTPMIFAFQLFDLSSFFITLLAFISFSLAASSIYIYNDINDIDIDQLHPLKRTRPIASGKMSIYRGYKISLVL